MKYGSGTEVIVKTVVTFTRSNLITSTLYQGVELAMPIIFNYCANPVIERKEIKSMVKSIYFAHDANAQDDPKCLFLIDQLGMEGYGIYWALIEKLRNESDSKLPMSIVPFFAKRWGTSKEKVETVIKNYNLFQLEEDHFFSVSLIRRIGELSERGKLAAGARWGGGSGGQKKPETAQKKVIL